MSAAAEVMDKQTDEQTNEQTNRWTSPLWKAFAAGLNNCLLSISSETYLMKHKYI